MTLESIMAADQSFDGFEARCAEVRAFEKKFLTKQAKEHAKDNAEFNQAGKVYVEYLKRAREKEES